MPNTRQNGLTTEEHAAPYDVSSASMYLPVHDKAAALDTIFKDTNVQHGLTMFARHELAALDLWQRGPRFYLHCLARRKKMLAKPEEVIRQLLVQASYVIWRKRIECLVWLLRGWLFGHRRGEVFIEEA